MPLHVKNGLHWFFPSLKESHRITQKSIFDARQFDVKLRIFLPSISTVTTLFTILNLSWEIDEEQWYETKSSSKLIFGSFWPLSVFFRNESGWYNIRSSRNILNGINYCWSQIWWSFSKILSEKKARIFCFLGKNCQKVCNKHSVLTHSG